MPIVKKYNIQKEYSSRKFIGSSYLFRKFGELNRATQERRIAKIILTIRMPRKMGEITERMPAPQYDQPSPAIKRTNSMPSGLEEANQ